MFDFLVQKCFFALICMALLTSCSPELIGEVNHISRYEEIREQFGDYPPVAHFPASIPSEALDAQFYFLPSLLQGGNNLQLRVSLPTEDVKDLLQSYRPLAIRTHLGGDKNEHANLPDGLPTTFFHTSEDGSATFPSTYEILVLGAQDGGSADHPWNHGHSYGVAIDEGALQIVY